jgi:hypothetical protein
MKKHNNKLNYHVTIWVAHRKKDFLKIQEYIHEGANLKLYIPEFINFELYIPEYSPILYRAFGSNCRILFFTVHPDSAMYEKLHTVPCYFARYKSRFFLFREITNIKFISQNYVTIFSQLYCTQLHSYPGGIV